MPKYRAGLHKEVSVIFDGVPIPRKNGTQQPSGAPTPDHTDHVPPEPPAPDQLTSPMPKPQEPTQPPPEAAPPKQPEVAPPKQPEAAPPKQPEATLPKQPPDAAPPKQPEVAPPKPPEAAPPKKPEDALLKPPEADAIPKIAKQAHWQQVWQQVGQQVWQQVWQQIENKLFTPKPGVSATKQKVMVISVPVLLMMLIFVLIQSLSTSPQKTNGPWSFEPTNVAAGLNIEIDWQIPQPYPTTLRAPTQFGRVSTAQGEPVKSDKLIVKGIVYSKDAACAMIDGQILYEGDQVSGATIVKINKRSVEFEMNGKRWAQKVQ